MGQVDIAFECDKCNESFDEMEDGALCSVCELYICEDCQGEHATVHCFEDCDAVLKIEEKKGKKKEGWKK